ncbi:MAG: hypothetical protein ACR2N1_10440 [Rubripirellula sp.]
MVLPLGSLATVAAKRWIRSGGFEGDDLENHWKDHWKDHWKGGQTIPFAVALAVHVEDCVDAT